MICACVYCYMRVHNVHADLVSPCLYFVFHAEPRCTLFPDRFLDQLFVRHVFQGDVARDWQGAFVSFYKHLEHILNTFQSFFPRFGVTTSGKLNATVICACFARHSKKKLLLLACQKSLSLSLSKQKVQIIFF